MKRSAITRAVRQFSFPGLSAIFLLLTNMAFGFFLHEINPSDFVWIIATAYIVLECGILSIAWHRTSDFILMGFQSDVGYSLMALAGASLAVVIVAWIQISTYFLMMLAAAMLLRIKLYTRRGSAVGSFVIMLTISLAGLAISWLPTLLNANQLEVLAHHTLGL